MIYTLNSAEDIAREFNVFLSAVDAMWFYRNINTNSYNLPTLAGGLKSFERYDHNPTEVWIVDEANVTFYCRGFDKIARSSEAQGWSNASGEIKYTGVTTAIEWVHEYNAIDCGYIPPKNTISVEPLYDFEGDVVKIVGF